MQINDVKTKVMEAISQCAGFNPEKVSEASDLRKDHGIDSIKMVQLIVTIEELFNIEVDSGSLSYENFANLNVISDFVLKTLEAQGR